jgi:hypothetical protein
MISCQLNEELIHQNKTFKDNFIKNGRIFLNEEVEELLIIIKNYKIFKNKEKVISEELKAGRMYLIDWSTVVAKKLNLCDETFFLALDIIDLMILRYKCQVTTNDLYLICLCAIFIASKYEEVAPIKLETLIKSVGHGKFTHEDILAAETLILKKLNFRIPKNNFLTFINLVTRNFDHDLRKKIIKHATSIYKLTLYDVTKFRFNKCTLGIYFSIFSFSLKTILKGDNELKLQLNAELLSIFLTKFKKEELYQVKKNSKRIQKLLNIVVNSKNDQFLYFNKFVSQNLIPEIKENSS